MLDKCLRGNKIAPFGTHALLCSALVPNGCNFIAPLALIYQFLIELFSIFSPLCRTCSTEPPLQQRSSVWRQTQLKWEAFKGIKKLTTFIFLTTHSTLKLSPKVQKFC